LVNILKVISSSFFIFSLYLSYDKFHSLFLTNWVSSNSPLRRNNTILITSLFFSLVKHFNKVTQNYQKTINCDCYSNEFKNE
jgi:hypothetical protein